MSKRSSRKNSVSRLTPSTFQRRQELQRLLAGRTMHVEKLEDRSLMTVGPHLAGIQPNVGTALPLTQLADGRYDLADVGRIGVLTEAPRELRLRFDDAQSFASQDVRGIRITRAGGDGQLSTTDDKSSDVVVLDSTLTGFNGFVGADPAPNQNVLVVRFPQTLPDDLYRVEIFGADINSKGIAGLRNLAGQLYVPSDSNPQLDRTVVDFKLSLGAEVTAVVPQPTSSLTGGKVSQQRDTILVYFNDDDFWPTRIKTSDYPDPVGRPSVVNPAFYQLIFTQDTVRNTDDVVFLPQEVTYDPVTNSAELKFASDLQELRYPADPAAYPSTWSGNPALLGTAVGYGTFRLRVGNNEIGIDKPEDLHPAPPTNLPITAAASTNFNTGGSVQATFTANGDYARHVTVTINSSDAFPSAGDLPLVTVIDRQIFITLNLLGGSSMNELQTALLGNPEASALVTMTGPYTGGFPTDDIAATVGDSVLKLQLFGQGSSFDAATLLDTAAGTVGNGNLVLPSNQHLQVTADITAAKEDRSRIPYPGMSDEPGQRDLPAEANNGGAQRINPAFGPDVNAGLETIPYNFKSLYGFDPLGNPLQNVINDTQKERIREALELWSNYIGVQFYETDDQGLTFATGDLRSLDATAPMIRTVPSGLVRIDPTYSDSLVVLDTNNTWNNAFGQSYFTSAMTAVGYLLGVGSSPELPTSGEPVYPSPSEVATGLLLHRAESNDIDMYKFTVDFSVGTSDATTGVFTAETFAERLSESSQLNTVLRLYKEVPAVNAASSTDFNSNGAVQVTFTAQESGNRGNSYQLSFSGGGASSTPQIIVVGRTINVVMNNDTTAQEVVDALNLNTDSAALVQARVTRGNAATKVGTFAINYSPVSLVGGADVRREVIAQNDNYYSQDSLLSVNLTSGTYYLGVSSVGNSDYDPTIEDSGYGGRTAGKYQLKVDFRPQVAASDSIRDLDYRTEGRMGTPLDGDGDGQPGGVYDFWFQTRNDNRVLEVIGDSGSFTDGQLITITNFLGVVRRFEINTTGGVGSGNVAVDLLPGESAATVAGKLAAAINGALGFNSSVVTVGGVGNNLLTFTGDRLVTLSTDIIGLKLNGKTIFVNKSAGPNADGSKDRPFNNVSSTTVPSAFSAAQPGDIVRIVGNGGSDGKMETLADNFAYEVGFGSLPGQTLSDGTTMEVPKGVTVMIDAGAIFKLRAARIGVGSSSLGVDRSGAALQVLGTPQQSVYFTSWFDQTIGLDTFLSATTPAKGNWGGIAFKNDLDRVKGQATDYESQGIFLNYVNNADIRYGGGIVNVDSIGQVVQPIQMSESRPTLTFNKITQSADSAMSADPASFTETYFNTPQYQLSGQFTPEYNRVGPMIHGNLLLDNSINGLFVRITTTSGTSTKTLTGQGRFDDTDIVHYIPENLEVEGTPGGPILDRTKLPTSLITVTPVSAGRLAAGLYSYRLTLVDADGYEGPASEATNAAALGSIGGVVLRNLPAAPAGFVARRVYRSTDGLNFDLVTQINAADVSYFDNGSTLGGALDIARSEVLRPRLNGRLSIDPGTVVKLEGARLEVSFGGQLLAEASNGQDVIFTSKMDDRFGAGGTFDTNNDNSQGVNERLPNPGDWGGIYVGQTSSTSLDHAFLAYGGGITKIEGTFKAFDVLEVQQGTFRLTNSVVERSSTGQGGQGPGDRLGRLANGSAVIFVRGSQPIIVNNVLRNNDDQTILGGGPQAAITIDVNSMNAANLADIGRQTGFVERFTNYDDNSGPLIRANRLARNGYNALVVRGEKLQTESIWDDTDIVHVVFSTVSVDNIYSQGGLRLQSSPTESLVVKFAGPGSSFDPNAGTGLTATGTPLDIVDRIGGSIYVLGQPGHPVVLTSLSDDSIGAGLQPDNAPQKDTNNNGIASIPVAGDWRGVFLDQNSNDRNVDYVIETESAAEIAPGSNASIVTAQVLGNLAASIQAGDENLRLGFSVQGYLSDPHDVDIYSFLGYAGTEVWIDVDRTSKSLDTVVELLNADGVVLARSNDSAAEGADPSLLYADPTVPSQFVNPMQKSAAGQRDFDTQNSRDAGLRIVLPGNVGTQTTYHFRVRSNGPDLSLTDTGLTKGLYRVSLRMRELDEFVGSVIRYADIRYATNGIVAQGLPAHSPLTGEVGENSEVAAGLEPEVDNGTFIAGVTPTGRGPQYIGNLLTTDRSTLSIGGTLTGFGDVDFYRFDTNYTLLSNTQAPPLTVPLTFDVDYADGLTRANTNLAVYDSFGRLVLIGRNSNIADDQARPLSGSDLADLSRGSAGQGDAFIGPVQVPTNGGSYYLAVFHNQRIPSELTQFTTLDSDDPLVRLEPINTVRRIAEDHIDVQGGATAEPPIMGPLLDPTFAGTGDNLWQITNAEPGPSNFGRGLNPTFDGSRAGGPGLVFDAENNDSLFTPQDIDGAAWNTLFDANIGDELVNTSQTIPHITVLGVGDGTYDYYRFVVPTDGARVILDIDFTTGGLDSWIGLWNADTGLLIDENDDPLTFDPGAGGSSTVLDSYIETNLAAGTYVVGVARFPTVPQNGGFVNTTSGFDSTIQVGTTYSLQISVENHAVTGNNSGGGDSFHFGNPAGGYQTISGLPARGDMVSNPFSLEGYSAGDQPVFYFTYFLAVDDAGDDFRVFVDDAVGGSTLVASSNADELRDARIRPLFNGSGEWRQARIDLSRFANQSNLQLRFNFQADGVGDRRAGAYVDDLIIGFAERGEMVTRPGLTSSGTPTFVQNPNSIESPQGEIASGPYQVEMRRASNFGSGQNPNPVTLILNRSIDTNDRLTEQVTLYTVPGAELTDGQTFTLGDGINLLTFEFNDPAGAFPSFNPENVPVTFDASMSAADVAAQIRAMINSPQVRSVLSLQAASADGSVAGATGGDARDNRVHIFGNVTGNVVLKAGDPIPPSAVYAIHTTDLGDSNTYRDQGQLLIDSNTVTFSRDFGIVVDAGLRDRTPNVPVPAGNSHPGAAIKFPALNNRAGDSLPGGGFTPGATVSNNLLAENGLGGIHVSGNLAPVEIRTRIPDDGITPGRPICTEASSTANGDTAGDQYRDGETFTLQMGRNTVTFEFEDIGGGSDTTPVCTGSGEIGGNGYNPANVPIFYRQSSGTLYLGRGTGYSQREMARAIANAINSSILTSNFTSLNTDDLGVTVSSQLDGLPAVYVDHIENFGMVSALANMLRRLPLALAPVPFARIVNNTIVGQDGTAALFPQAYAESNDSIETAIDTKQGRQMKPDVYTVTGSIGDNPTYRLDPSLDVDFYRFHLDIADRVEIDLDTPAVQGRLNTLIRLFNEQGQEVARSDDNAAPGETASTESYLNFTATASGSYYVAVSAAGNGSYDARSLNNRQTATTLGQYTMSLDVSHPNTAALLVNQTTYPAGSAFLVRDVAGNTAIFEYTNGGGATIPGAIAIVQDPAEFRRADTAVATANAINGAAALSNGMSLPNGVFGNASPLTRVIARAMGGPAGSDGGPALYPPNGLDSSPNAWSHDRPATGVAAWGEQWVTLLNVAEVRVLSGPIQLTPAGDNNSNVLLETGVLASERSGPTLVNNIFANLNSGFVNLSSTTFGTASVVSGSVFQHTLTTTTTSAPGIDFNIQLGNNEPLFVNPENGNYYPIAPSRVIDSAVSSIQDREDFANRVKAPLGLPSSPIAAPELDNRGTLRIDNPFVANAQGQGDNVFKDRGALDVADFVSPTAELLGPKDNDALAIDQDPSATVVRLASGVYSQFRVQIQDTFGADNPFPGTQADSNTILTSPVTIDENGVAVTLVGAGVTLYQDNRMLREGFDYSFSYDSLTRTIILTPLAGLWNDASVYEIQLNNRDRIVIDSPTGATTTDGQTFTITDGTGAKVTFEYEAGYRMQVPQTLSLLVPLAGGGLAPGSITDGQKFTVSDGKRTVTFEYNSSGGVTAGNTAIPFVVNASQDDLAIATVAALQTAIDGNRLVGLQPRYLGRGEIHIGATSTASVTTAGSTLTLNFAQRPLSINLPAVGLGAGGITDGETIRISNTALNRTITFEFDNVVNSPGVKPGNTAVAYNPTDTLDVIADNLALAISLSNLALPALNAGDGVISLQAGSQHTLDVTNTVATRTMFIAGIADGEFFDVRRTVSGVTTQQRFLFDFSGRVPLPGTTLIALTSADTQQDLTTKIAAAVTADGLGLTPTQFANGNLLIGGTTEYVVDASSAPSVVLQGKPGVQTNTQIVLPSSLAIQVPAGNAIPDGLLFTISDGTRQVVFEFNNDGRFTDANNDFVPDNLLVPFLTSMSQDQVADAVLTAITSAGLSLSPPIANNPVNGLVILGTSPEDTVSTDGIILQTQEIILGLRDGDSFTIDDGTRSQSFEFEDNALNNGVTAGRLPIFFDARATVDAVADSIVAAIKNAALCTNDGVSCLGGTTNLGRGVVQLDDTGRHTTTLGPNSPLTLTGVPGGAVVVNFIPDVTYSDEQMAAQIIDAINKNAGSRLTGVTASLRGGSTVYVDFQNRDGSALDFSTTPASILGVSNFFLPAIKDGYGNLLRGNQPSNQTKFTILMPQVGVDYGDSPDPFSGAGRYPTVEANDGARHTISAANPLFLGATIDADPFAMPNPQANGDDTDLRVNLTFSPGLSQTGADGRQLITVGLDTNGNPDIADGNVFWLCDRGIDLCPIDDPANWKLYEFDNNASVIDGRTVIQFTATSTVNDIVNGMVDAIRRSGISAQATNAGSGTLQLNAQDDNGVVFGVQPVGGDRFGHLFNEYLDTIVNVTSSGTGFIDAWIDYNQDGDWLDPGEQIIKSAAAVVGNNAFTIRTLAGAAPGATYARFRLSTTGGLLPTGLAVGGEVEDYRITILPGIPPVANADPTASDPVQVAAYTTSEEADISITANLGLLANDTDADTAPAGISIYQVNGLAANVGTGITLPSGALLTVLSDGSFLYDPRPSSTLDALAVGDIFLDSFTYTAWDGVLPSNTANVTIQVTGVNDPPQAFPNQYTVSEDAQLAGQNVILDDTGAGADRDLDRGDLLQLTAINGVALTGTANVVVTLASGATVTAIYNANLGRFDGNFVYDPTTSATLQSLPQGTTGSDTFTYAIRDRSGATSAATVTLNITGQNDAPSAPNRTYNTHEDVVFAGANLVSDLPAVTDPDVGESASIALSQINGASFVVNSPITLPSGAVLTVTSAGGAFTYDPRTAFNYLRVGQSANDTFTYGVVDVNGAVGTATVTLVVDGRNDTPIAVANSYSTNDNTTITNRNLLTDNTGSGVDFDPDIGDVLRIVSIQTPTSNFVISGTANVSVVIDSGATVTVLYNATLGRFDGSFIYDPTTSASLNALQIGQTGTDVFSYGVGDGLASSTASVTITVAGANDPPVATPDQLTTDEDTLLSDNVITRVPADFDPDAGDTATLTVVAINGIANNVGATITTSKGATLRVTTSGAVTYDPRGSATLQALAAGQTDTDTFTYTVADNRGGSSTATVTVTVTGVNDNPIARPNSYTTDDNTVLLGKNVITDSPADTDPDTGDTALLRITAVQGDTSGVGTPVASAKGATVTISSDGSLVYDPTTSATLNALQVGQSTTDTFTYTVGDGKGGAATATVTISVVGVNDPPVARNNSYTTNENTALANRNVITDAPADSDADAGDIITVTAINGAPNVGKTLTSDFGASFRVMANGAFTYDPTTSATLNALTTGDSVGDSFTYTITDSKGATSTATVIVTVTGINDPPSVLNDSATTNKGTPITINVLANDSDPEGPITNGTVTIIPGTGPAHGTAVVQANGSVRYTPNATYTGLDSFQYTVTDSQGAVSLPALVTIDVVPIPSPFQNPVNPPDVNADTFVSPIDALLIINFLNVNPGVTTPPAAPPFLDVDGSFTVEPLDALIVINRLNTGGASEGAGEGEGEGITAADAWNQALVMSPLAVGLPGTSLLVDHRWSPGDSLATNGAGSSGSSSSPSAASAKNAYEAAFAVLASDVSVAMDVGGELAGVTAQSAASAAADNSAWDEALDDLLDGSSW